jgi:DNA-binding transcriptional LysR family regulator
MGTCCSCGTVGSPPVLRSWRRRSPDVELDLKEYTSADAMLEVLLGGGADITVGPSPTRTDEHIEVLGDEEIVVVAAPEHRFSEMDAVPLAELSAEPLVHYDPGNGNGVWLDRFAAKRGVVLSQPTLRTGNPRTAAQLAAADMGVPPPSYHLECSEVVVRPPELATACSPAAALSANGCPAHRTTEALLSWLVADVLSCM